MPLLLLLLNLVFASCTPNINEDNLDLSEPLSEPDSSATQKSAFTEAEQVLNISGLTPKSTVKINYFECRAATGKSWVIYLNNDFDAHSTGVCGKPVAQKFLANGWNVVAINRPGYGIASDGQDFGGPLTQKFVQDLAKKYPPVIGILATGIGASAAGFASKSMRDLKWLILGNGIFDLEVFTTTGTTTDRYQKLIKSAESTSKNPSQFAEQRSIAWDTSGLPKEVYLYFGKANVDVGLEQSKALLDRLAAEEHTVKLEPVDGVSNDIPPAKEAIIIDKFIKIIRL